MHARDLFFGLLASDGFAALARTLGRDRRDPRIAQMMMGGRSKGLVDLLVTVSRRGRLKREEVANYGHCDTAHYWRPVEETIDYRRRFLEAPSAYDAIVCPAVALPSPRQGRARFQAL